jgi:hypothetical protein
MMGIALSAARSCWHLRKAMVSLTGLWLNPGAAQHMIPEALVIGIQLLAVLAPDRLVAGIIMMTPETGITLSLCGCWHYFSSLK